MTDKLQFGHFICCFQIFFFLVDKGSYIHMVFYAAGIVGESCKEANNTSCSSPVSFNASLLFIIFI